MIGLVLALFSGSFWSVSVTYISKGTHRSGEAFSPVPIFAFTGMVLFGIPLFISGGAAELTSVSWLGLGVLAGSGVIHFILGRMLIFTSIRLIGGNRAAPITSCNILFAALIGILFLGEPLTIPLVLALLLITGGIILISTTGSTNTGQPGMPGGSLVKGVLAALGAALLLGITPALIKVGLREVGSPLLATFISYAAAAIVMGISLFHPRNNEKLRRLTRASLIPIIIAASASSIAQILKYTALDYSPISLVTPVSGGAKTLLVFPLSFLINREIESFNPRIIMGAIAIVVGIFLVFWGV